MQSLREDQRAATALDLRERAESIQLRPKEEVGMVNGLGDAQESHRVKNRHQRGASLPARLPTLAMEPLGTRALGAGKVLHLR